MSDEKIAEDFERSNALLPATKAYTNGYRAGERDALSNIKPGYDLGNGLVAVPRIPTSTMCQAPRIGEMRLEIDGKPISSSLCHAVWDIMIAAVKPEAADAETEGQSHD